MMNTLSLQMAFLPDVQPEAIEPLTKEDEYTQYIRSPQWKQLRSKALQRANGRCEECGVSEWSVTLEVHHCTYVRFKRESLDDLKVLCPACHEKADKRRPYTQKLYFQDVDPFKTKIENWAKWKFGDGWKNSMDWNDVVAKYLSWRAGAYEP